MSQLAKQLIAQEKQNRTGRLNLGNCGLTNLETEVPELFELTHLEELVLSNEWQWNEEKKSWEQKKSQNKGEANSLAKLPEGIGRLKSLRVLICAGWRYDLGITNLSPLSELVNLMQLDLSSNQITDLLPLSKLGNLTELNLSFNQITDLSPLSGLVNLTELNLGINQITDLSPLSGLVNLTRLFLTDNQITDLSPLSGLVNLTQLDLLFNKITSSITLSFLRQFPHLTHLGLMGNPITNLPTELSFLPEVNRYLLDLEEGGEANNEVKILFIGNGGVGKTQVAKRLVLQDNFDFDEQHHSTHAITLFQHNLANNLLNPDLQAALPQGLLLNLWDFGGQDIYHATHRLFMRTRALFLLIWDKKSEASEYHTWEEHKYKNEPLRYWLAYTHYFSKGSPIIVLQNKIDAPSTLPDPYAEPQQNELKELYPAIADFVAASAKTGKGFMTLQNGIAQLFSQDETLKNDLLHKPLPKKWLALRQRIREEQGLCNGATDIDIATFEHWCADAEVPTQSVQVLLSFLHDTGVLYYQKRNFGGRIILNQAWAIKAVYQVLDRQGQYYELLEHNKGKLNYTDICRLWNKHTDEERELFLNFMLSSELCFETTPNKEHDTPLKDRTFIVPQLLPQDEPGYVKETFEQGYGVALTHTLSYRFLPSVFIQRFIIRAERFSEHAYMWQQGIALEYDKPEYGKACAIVRAKYEENPTIHICYNEAAKQTGLFTAITEELEKLAAEDQDKPKPEKEKSGFDVLVPVTKTTPTPHQIPPNNMTKKLNVFISYSPEDETFKKALEKHLILLKRSDTIATWDSSNVLAGSDLNTTIQKLEDAHVIIILTSANYIADDDLWKEHLQRAMNRHDNNEARVIPIKVTDFDSKDLPFAKIQGLPRNGQAIGSPSNDTLWTEVATEIRAVVTDILNKGIGVDEQSETDTMKDKIETEESKNSNPQPQTNQVKKVLFICASPNDVNRKLDFGREFNNIENALNTSPNRNKFTITIRTGVKFDELPRLLMNIKPDILHISMHSSLQRGGLLFEHNDGTTQALSPSNFRDMVSSSGKALELIVLSACNSKNHAEELDDQAQHIIGMNDFISDEAAAYYASKFYEIYFDQENVSMSHNTAIITLRVNNQIKDSEKYSQVPYIQK